MQHYRLYVVTAGEDISQTLEREYPNDHEAMAQAARPRAQNGQAHG